MSSIFSEKDLIPYINMSEFVPMPMAIFEPKKLRLITANDKMLDLWDRTPAIFGMTLVDFLPEMASQRYPELLSTVGVTGNAVQEKNAVVMLKKNGQLEQVNMDFSYSPVYAKPGHNPAAIIVYASPCNIQQVYQKSIDCQDQNLRAMVLAALTPMCVYSGENMQVLVVNEKMLELWERERSRKTDLLKAVFHTGVMMKQEENGIVYSCTPRRAPQGNIIGCILVASSVS